MTHTYRCGAWGVTAACMCLMITDALNPPKVATCIQTVVDGNKLVHVLARFPLDKPTPVNRIPRYILSHSPGECK